VLFSVRIGLTTAAVVMSIGSDIRDKTGQLDDSPGKSLAGISSDAIPYFLSTADALVIVLGELGRWHWLPTIGGQSDT